jgi:hypothetical protein
MKLTAVATVAALFAGTVPLPADPWDETKEAGCLGLLVALDEANLLRPEIVTYMTGLWDGALASGRFDEHALEVAYWKLCKENPGRNIYETFTAAIKAAENLP